ncbi:GNAT family N-acetyltransferase [Roseofilum casamattae]|uniref:GNAT family N-acetyltransferase n=1 Tax=Roseofilum casamattae BLCC-M143 TaxID=3022442 RepID=A0ABT7BSQ9_9CYAN|nr:GNAT family N-acetyltransferase [Roseofilum casamattae]MDJ1182219.1 GNAT family N-acetyltransferase [Roseofilum casamattae BLCC-M143]
MIRVITAQTAQPLIAELDNYLNALYADGDNEQYLDSVEVLSQDRVAIFGAFEDEVLCAIGAVKVFAADGYGEMKRVYVRPAYRRRGLAKAIVKQLEARLIELGIAECKLLTGEYQQDALKLYRSLGYVECDRFGNYPRDSREVYLSKILSVSPRENASGPVIRQISATTAQPLIAELDRYLESIYPAASNYLDSVEVLAQDHVAIFGAFEDEVLCAIGAIKVFAADGYGEMKRVYVRPAYRGRGLAKAIIAQLEARLIIAGIRECKLETGKYQPEALALYRRLGYVECDRFGDYEDCDLSVYLSKTLEPTKLHY